MVVPVLHYLYVTAAAIVVIVRKNNATIHYLSAT